MKKVFDTSKTPEQYKEVTSLFMGEPLGLFDTVNKHHPKIWGWYKEMKSLDWSEDEFDYAQCNLDFKNCPKDVADMMIRTLAWQWEADSIASRAIAPLLAPFITSSELWAAYQRVSDNEVIHAATYSEIVRLSFDNPEDVMKEILAVKESFARMETVKQVFDKMYRVSHEYALGLITKEEAYDTLLLFLCTVFILERVQFPASFGITFTICGTGWFQPIGKAVQKIAQDEFEVHVGLGMDVIKHELKTTIGNEAYARIKPIVQKIFNEVVQTELKWNAYQFDNGNRQLVGATMKSVDDWMLFNAYQAFKFLMLENDMGFKFPKHNPMLHLENWIDISKTQAAPQEQDGNQYKVGSIVRDDEAKTFDVDF